MKTVEMIPAIAEMKAIIHKNHASDALSCARSHGGMIDSATLGRELNLSLWHAQAVLSGLCDDGEMFYTSPLTGLYHVGRDM